MLLLLVLMLLLTLQSEREAHIGSAASNDNDGAAKMVCGCCRLHQCMAAVSGVVKWLNVLGTFVGAKLLLLLVFVVPIFSGKNFFFLLLLSLWSGLFAVERQPLQFLLLMLVDHVCKNSFDV